MRFGNKHLQQMYQAQLKGRNQRVDESLQQYEADLARLVHLAYPTAPQDFMEQLGVQIFIDGTRDHKTQQTLRLARSKTLNEALTTALEFDAAKQVSKGHARVVDDFLNKLFAMRDDMNTEKSGSFRQQNSLECWNCGERGQIRPRCPKLRGDNKPPLSNRKTTRKTSTSQLPGADAD
ncbi:hypothetical protein NQ318_015995 [Aromia moschata]|uniref:CCHC-type domain-containing protein n=1 Tax=Aromia moschata TaxID=1265417 RepID=A0AAV8Y2Y3_9CUCU|nr:hypothetical protein NQ318_015995 [Aromia moschata]